MQFVHKFNSRTQMTFDANTPKVFLNILAAFSEVIDAGASCGLCESQEVSPQCRKSKDGHAFYGMKCRSCGAQMDFGQHREGETLFPKVREEYGSLWYQYDPSKNQSQNGQNSQYSQRAPQQQQPAPTQQRGDEVPF